MKKALRFIQLLSFPVAVATLAGFVCAENTLTIRNAKNRSTSRLHNSVPVRAVTHDDAMLILLKTAVPFLLVTSNMFVIMFLLLLQGLQSL
jgi:hypothetical protein